MKLDDVIFFFIRHGETQGNKDNVYRGWSNAPEAQLDESGCRSSREAGRYLSMIGAPIELVISDSLDRVQETIELVAESFQNARLEFVRSLHPLNMGDLTLKSKDKYPVEPYLKDPKKRIPGGDTVEEFNKRQFEIFTSIFGLTKTMKGGRILVGGHGSNVAFLCNHVFNKGEERIGYEGMVDPGGIIAATASGLIPLTKVRGKKNKSGLVQLDGTPLYPSDHEAGMRVPKGGSSCESCEYLKDAKKKICGNKFFIAWEGKDKPAGSDVIPAPIDSYCSDWYEPKEKK